MTESFGFWAGTEESKTTTTAIGVNVKEDTTLEDKSEENLVIKAEPGLLDRLKKLKSHKMQILFVTAIILSCISFTATPAIFYLLCKVFSNK